MHDQNLILPGMPSAAGKRDPDFFQSAPADRMDTREKNRWVDGMKKKARIKGCTHATAAEVDCPDGKALVVAGWKLDPAWLY